jgi:hypothetical protein
VAAGLGVPLATECAQIARDDGRWLFSRKAFNGKFIQVLDLGKARPLVATIQKGASAPFDGATAGQVRAVPPALGDLKARFVEIKQGGAGGVDLTQAPIIVAGGRGVGAADKFEIIKSLAAALGGEVGASRPVTDMGWLPHEHQIGSSGVTVNPKLYIACGISGAIQHIVGMKGSGYIVAINKDPEAPIFGVADVGVAGDLFEIVPAGRGQGRTGSVGRRAVRSSPQTPSAFAAPSTSFWATQRIIPKPPPPPQAALAACTLMPASDSLRATSATAPGRSFPWTNSACRRALKVMPDFFAAFSRAAGSSGTTSICDRPPPIGKAVIDSRLTPASLRELRRRNPSPAGLGRRKGRRVGFVGHYAPPGLDDLTCAECWHRHFRSAADDVEAEPRTRAGLGPGEWSSGRPGPGDAVRHPAPGGGSSFHHRRQLERDPPPADVAHRAAPPADNRLTADVDRSIPQDAPAAARQGPDPNKVYTVKTEGSPFKGPKNAPVTIAEFSDFQ